MRALGIALFAMYVVEKRRHLFVVIRLLSEDILATLFSLAYVRKRRVSLLDKNSSVATISSKEKKRNKIDTEQKEEEKIHMSRRRKREKKGLKKRRNTHVTWIETTASATSRRPKTVVRETFHRDMQLRRRERTARGERQACTRDRESQRPATCDTPVLYTRRKFWRARSACCCRSARSTSIVQGRYVRP